MISGAHTSFTSGAPVELDVDYVIVGSGPGGSAAAAILARAGRRPNLGRYRARRGGCPRLR